MSINWLKPFLHSSKSRRHRLGHGRRLHQRIEALEDRTLLATVAWDGGGDGSSWKDPMNWANDELPGLADDVVVGSQFAGDTIRIFPDPFFNVIDVNSINSFAALYVEDSAFQVHSDSSVGGLTASTGSRFFEGPTGTARFDVNGPFTWFSDSVPGTSDSVVGGGVSEFHVFGTVTISGNDPKGLGTTIHNYGTDSVLMPTGEVYSGGQIYNHGTVTIDTNFSFGRAIGGGAGCSTTPPEPP